MRRCSTLIAVGLLLVLPVRAQHDHGGEADEDAETADVRADHDMGAMSSTLLPSLPMTRDGSGTTWQPDASPMHAVHTSAGSWNLMVHGMAALRYVNQDAFDSGNRGNSSVDSPNWLMVMGQRNVNRSSQVALRGMLSLEPITQGGNGYPLLFQTGETFEGEPLVDRQHPHDLFMELAALYGKDLGENVGVFAYVGYPGEPALGPPAFQHRPSGMHNPDAALGHHWQDATHITFGVATLGLRYDVFKLDGSIFTGREPDEARYGFDRPRFDSYSGRIAANPTDRLALQVSRGFLKSPEVLEPDEDVWRTTASVLYNLPLRGSNNLAAAIVWGLNEKSAEHDTEHAHDDVQHTWLLESDLQLGPQVFYTRLEWGSRVAHDLQLEDQFGDDERFWIGAATLGAARDLFELGSLKTMLGAHSTFYSVPESLRPIYGSSPISVEVFLRLSPKRMMGGADGNGPAPGHDHMHEM